MIWKWSVVLACALLWAAPTRTALAQGEWEEDIRAFEEADAANPPQKGAVLFVGSSSIRGWTSLEEDFEGTTVLNRGFGGSELEDVIHYADRIVVPYEPRLIVLYEGDNDIANGKSAEDVFRNYRQFVALVREKLPDTRIAFISIKPSLARWEMAPEMRQANARIEAYARERSYLDYIDVFGPMLGPDGTPRPELFVEDGLHMNAEGYALWADAVEPYLSVQQSE